MQVYDGAGNWTSAESVKKQSDAMHEKLQAHGYEYINIDAGWNGDMDEYGRPIPSEVLYPNGFQEVIDYVHNNGQKIGIYLIPGYLSMHITEILRCMGQAANVVFRILRPSRLPLWIIGIPTPIKLISRIPVPRSMWIPLQICLVSGGSISSNSTA